MFAAPSEDPEAFVAVGIDLFEGSSARVDFIAGIKQNTKNTNDEQTN